MILRKFPQELVNGALSLVRKGRLKRSIGLICESSIAVLLILVADGLQGDIGILLSREGIVVFLIVFTHLCLPDIAYSPRS